MSFIKSTIKCTRCGYQMNVSLGTFGDGLPKDCPDCKRLLTYETISDFEWIVSNSLDNSKREVSDCHQEEIIEEYGDKLCGSCNRTCKPFTPAPLIEKGECNCGAQDGTIDGSWKCTKECISNFSPIPKKEEWEKDFDRMFKVKPEMTFTDVLGRAHHIKGFIQGILASQSKSIEHCAEENCPECERGLLDKVLGEKVEKIRQLETIDGSITDGFKQVILSILTKDTK